MSWFRKTKSAAGRVQDFFDEKALKNAHLVPLTPAQQFAHFWLLVARSFTRNRCPVRAAALSYTTLLALIPLLVVALSVSTSILRKQGEQKVYAFIDKLVDGVMPPAAFNAAEAPASPPPQVTTNIPPTANPAPNLTGTNLALALNSTNSPVAPSGEAKYVASRRQVTDAIHGFITNTRSGKLGLTGTVALIFVAISLLSRVEETFNDIWGVTRGRNWFMRIVQYWAVISLGPVLLATAVGLASGAHFQSTKDLLTAMPFVSRLLFEVLPVVVLCLSLAVFYMLMPNTKVPWTAAMFGGLVAGVLLHLNNAFSVFYVSRVVTNSKIYGSLGLVPVFMVGMYCSWIILLLGAQVAYAWQNRNAYFQEIQAEHVNQRGREFIALRIMQCVGGRFQRGERPASPDEIAAQLAVPTRLVQRILTTLRAARIVVETTGKENACAPARPLDQITCHDILLAMRAGEGQELATRDEPARAEVYGEFMKILAAEKSAASSVSLLAMVNRTAAALPAPPGPAVTIEPA